MELGAAMGRRAKWKPLELFKSNSEPKAALRLGKLCQLVLPGEAVSVREHTVCASTANLLWNYSEASSRTMQWQMSADCCRGIAAGSHKTSASCGAEQWTGKQTDSPSLWESAFITSWISSLFPQQETVFELWQKPMGVIYLDIYFTYKFSRRHLSEHSHKTTVDIHFY